MSKREMINHYSSEMREIDKHITVLRASIEELTLRKSRIQTNLAKLETKQDRRPKSCVLSDTQKAQLQSSILKA